MYPRLIKNLSKGYRQRVGFAQALIGNPPVLVLDEPTVGLDPNQIIEIRTLIKSLGRHHTVILSSHILSEIEAVCDRIVVIHRGNIVADSTAADLSRKYSEDRRLTARVKGPAAETAQLLASVAGVKKVTPLGMREAGMYDFVIEPKENVDVREEIFRRLAERNWPLVGLRSMEMSLEEIFIELTREQPLLPTGKKERRKAKEAEK